MENLGWYVVEFYFMYVNLNFFVKLYLDLQLVKNKYVYYRIFCNLKDNIMLMFFFFVIYDNIY